MLRNVTASGNVAGGEGAIYNRGTLTAAHITVADHGASNAVFGGLFAFNADTVLVNSIFADNRGSNCFISGGDRAVVASLSESGNCHTSLSDDAALLPLADNGGFTRTQALRLDSPAIDAGDPSFCLDTDQCGVARPQNDGCDLGAFEVDTIGIFADDFEQGAPARRPAARAE